MISVLWNLVSFIVALSILVAVHEFGHFWVARRCGVKVEKFSIGFGKSLWKRKGKDGVEYSLSMIPLGGFVKMLDSRAGEVAESEKHLAFDHKSLWRRSAIVAAGPIFNFLFAIFAYWLVFLIGVPQVKPIVGTVTPHSIISNAGITPGMELKRISGLETEDWNSVNMALASNIGDQSIDVVVSYPGEINNERTIQLDTTDWTVDIESGDGIMRTLGFTPYRPEIQTKVSNVSEGSAAERAGFIINDELISINGQSIVNWQQVVDTIESNPNKNVQIQVTRGQDLVNLTLTPDAKQNSKGNVVGFAGLAPTISEWPPGYVFEQQYGVFGSIPKALDKTGQVLQLTITMIKKLFTGDVGVDSLSGPISIAKGAGATAGYGIVSFLGFLALISINLGIINLVPLPVLDGGHLLFFAIEAVIKRPISENVQNICYRLGTAAIVSLMLIAIFNDVARL